MTESSAATVPVLQFRLVHIFYTMALLGSGLATFGVGGLPVSLLLLLFWGYVFSRRSRKLGLANGCLVVSVCGCVFGWCLLLPSLEHREASRRAQCSNNLKQIALALQNYHEVYHEFPPAYIADRDGKPLHSWRVLILPFLEQKSLYDQYRFDEPWDGPNNRKLADKLERWYPLACPSDSRQTSSQLQWTSYVAVVGPRTTLRAERSCSLQEIPDGTSHTAIVVEYLGQQIPWMEPRDLAWDEALRVLSAPAPEEAGLHRTEDFFYEYFRGRQVAFVDGSVQSVSWDTTPQIWAALLAVDDGVKFSDADLREAIYGRRRLKVGNCVRLATFILLAIWPLPWVWREPR